MAGRRPRALVADSLLAIGLAIVSLALADTGSAVQKGPVPRYDWNLAPPPRDVQPGDVWNARIVVFRDGVPAAAPGKATPLLTVQNMTTGKWSTKAAEPTGTAEFYRARVVFRDPGEHVDAEAAADDISRRLVAGGLAIRRFERSCASLEERFLEVTT